jgi:autotransporter family porin
MMRTIATYLLFLLASGVSGLMAVPEAQAADDLYVHGGGGGGGRDASSYATGAGGGAGGYVGSTSPSAFAGGSGGASGSSAAGTGSGSGGIGGGSNGSGGIGSGGSGADGAGGVGNGIGTSSGATGSGGSGGDGGNAESVVASDTFGTVDIKGGAGGGAGVSNNSGGGGGGGNGGTAQLTGTDITVTTLSMTGGIGGAGGNINGSNGAVAGGNGGNAQLTGTDITVTTLSMTGGIGGAGGGSLCCGNGGAGGNGGDTVLAASSQTIIVSGTLTLSSGTDGANGTNSGYAGGTGGTGGGVYLTAGTLKAGTINLTENDGALTFNVTNLEIGDVGTTLDVSGLVGSTATIDYLLLTNAQNFTLTGANAAIGQLKINGGTLNDTNFSNLTGITYSNQAINIGSGNATIETTTGQALDRVLTGVGGLTKTGSGVLTLTGTNTYHGNTTVSAGTLELTGSLTNYANVIVKSGGIFDLSGKLTTQNITIESGAFFNITGTILTVNGTLDVESGGMFDLVSHSGPLNLGGVSVLHNAGTVRLNNPTTVGNTLIVGAYEGVDGSILALNTVLGGDDSPTDKLHVTGNITGSSWIAITNVDGVGAQTVSGIPVVQVDGTSSEKSSDGGNPNPDANFKLANTVQAGAYEYVLQSRGESWFLVNFHDDGGSGDDNGNDDSNIPIYRPGVANYLGVQAVNAEQALQQMTTLHQRVGEHRALPLERQSWARTYYTQSSEDGKRRFGYDQQTTGLQIGHEVFASASGDGGTLRAALAFDYARTDADFDDRTRPALERNRDTGSVKAESYAVGGYLTRTAENGAYVDLVGQAATLKNKFTTKTDTAHDKATQKGWRAGVSVESGYPLWKIGAAWLLEGQAQLSYQYTKYQSFKDDTSKVGSYDADTLRGRLGARIVRELTTAENKPLKLYGLANVHRDFLKPASVPIGNGDGSYTRISERYGKSWGELGVGIQGWVNKSTSVFGDLRYQHGFSSPDKGDAREGGAVNIGARLVIVSKSIDINTFINTLPFHHNI